MAEEKWTDTAAHRYVDHDDHITSYTQHPADLRDLPGLPARCETRVVAPPGGKTAVVVQAPPQERHKSKHYDLLEKEAAFLDAEKQYLHQQALSKERQFKKNVAKFANRIERFKKKISDEEAIRDAEDARIREYWTKGLREIEVNFERQLASECSLVTDELLPPIAQRLDDWKADFDHFVNVTVPTTIENQSGRVTRHLIKSQETFEIDNTKLMKREKKIVERFEARVKDVAENFVELAKKRKKCFTLLDEDMEAAERLADRNEERVHSWAMEEVAGLRDEVGGLPGVRKQADEVTLERLEETMRNLQQIILTNFGMRDPATIAAEEEAKADADDESAYGAEGAAAEAAEMGGAAAAGGGDEDGGAGGAGGGGDDGAGSEEEGGGEDEGGEEAPPDDGAADGADG